MAPRRVETRVARVSAGDLVPAGAPPTTPDGLRALTSPALLAAAAERLTRSSIDAIGYASTSSAYAIGFDEELDLVFGLSRRFRIPVIPTCASAVLALLLFDVRRVALIHPPWFDQELNELGAEYFESQALRVVMSASAGVVNDPDRIDPAAVCAWTARHVPDDAEAVFIGGNGFRVARAIAPLEAAIGRPVLESNQVLLWNLLAQTGTRLRLRGFGRLFAQEPASGAAASAMRQTEEALP